MQFLWGSRLVFTLVLDWEVCPQPSDNHWLNLSHLWLGERPRAPTRIQSGVVS